MAKQSIPGAEPRQEHFESLELSDCKVPIGCPWGADCPEDAFPDHWADEPKKLAERESSSG